MNPTEVIPAADLVRVTAVRTVTRLYRCVLVRQRGRLTVSEWEEVGGYRRLEDVGILGTVRLGEQRRFQVTEGE